jgi:hypothetical protein
LFSASTPEADISARVRPVAWRCCGLWCRVGGSGETYCLRNVDTVYVRVYTASQPIRTSAAPPPGELQPPHRPVYCWRGVCSVLWALLVAAYFPLYQNIVESLRGMFHECRMLFSCTKKCSVFWLIAREAYSSFQEERKRHSHISQFHFHPWLFFYTVLQSVMLWIVPLKCFFCHWFACSA